MSIVSLLVLLVVVGVALYLVNTLIPMDGKIRTIINVIVFLLVCLWLLDTFVVDIGTVGRPVLLR